MSYKNEGETKILSDKQKPKEYVASKLTSQEILKEVFQDPRKWQDSNSNPHESKRALIYL